MTEAMVFGGLVIAAAVIAILAFLAYRRWSAATLKVGDPIIYRKQKASTHPGVRACDIHPATQGEFYYYLVDKYWVVESVLLDGRIVARTRTNKHHYLRPEDPNLRKARLIERARYRERFPQLAA